MQILASEGLKVSPPIVPGVERENEKHSWSDSATLSETMSIGTHWMRTSSLRVRLSLSATKSLVAINKVR